MTRRAVLLTLLVWALVAAPAAAAAGDRDAGRGTTLVTAHSDPPAQDDPPAEHDPRDELQPAAEPVYPAPVGEAAPVLERPVPEAPGPAPAPPLAVSDSGAARVLLRCTRPRACRGTVRLRAGGERVAFERFKLRPRTSRKVVLRLNRAARERVLGGHEVQARLIVRFAQRRARIARIRLVRSPVAGTGVRDHRGPAASAGAGSAVL